MCTPSIGACWTPAYPSSANLDERHGNFWKCESRTRLQSARSLLEPAPTTPGEPTRTDAAQERSRCGIGSISIKVMTFTYRFQQPPSEVYGAVMQAVRQLENLRSTDPNSMQISFATKMSGWSWGSEWFIQLGPDGTGTFMNAWMGAAGSLVAGMTEKKKIDRIWATAARFLSEGEAARRSTEAPAPPVPPPYEPPNDDAVEVRLAKAKQLFDEGQISEEEYEATRLNILKAI